FVAVILFREAFGVRPRPRIAFEDTGRTLEKRCEDAPHFVRNQKKWPQLSRKPRHFMLAHDFTKTVLHRHDLRHWLLRVRSCQRRDVAFQRAAAETAEGKIPVRADTAVA